jgi:hypothetical protein
MPGAEGIEIEASKLASCAGITGAAVLAATRDEVSVISARVSGPKCRK